MIHKSGGVADEKKVILGLALPFFLISMILGSIPAQAQTARPDVYTVQETKAQGAVATRLNVADRYETAKAISEQVNHARATDVILTSGNNFPDALSASVLAKKLNAPFCWSTVRFRAQVKPLLISMLIFGRMEAFISSGEQELLGKILSINSIKQHSQTLTDWVGLTATSKNLV